MRKHFPIAVAVLAVFHSTALVGQVSRGGLPPGYTGKATLSDMPVVTVEKPGLAGYTNPQPKAVPPRVGVNIPVTISFSEAGQWQDRDICRLMVRAPGALAVGLYYSDFVIPEGGRLFIYNTEQTYYIGAFDAASNRDGGKFATELIPGEEVILEYTGPRDERNRPRILINEVLYAFQNLGPLMPGRGFGDAGPCEVNINCSEGDNWKNEKRGVARVLVKDGGSSFWCSGSLINNVRRDSLPYFLTANHCGPNATAGDYAQWIFYFNYEAPGCDEPLQDPGSNTISGSSLIARGLNDPPAGSDFKLLLLDEELPLHYNPYFNGWNRSNAPAISGVGIHHPQGDVKKISTFTQEATSTAYNGSSPQGDEKYWRVTWESTNHGHGVTEGGSSGSPLFDNHHRIVGTLTGGAASCQNPTAPDYYGKIWYSWESNGSSSAFQLHPWLDPDNAGVTELEGFGYGDMLISAFIADTNEIALGSVVNFQDLSSGKPDSWEWYFEGGAPYRSSVRVPGEITYAVAGIYDVRLVVGKGTHTDTLVKKDYIKVKARIYPNPATSWFYLDLGNEPAGGVRVCINDLHGNLVYEWRQDDKVAGRRRIVLPFLRKGMYIVEYTLNGDVLPPAKLIIE
ncbi:MAG: T9SS type A sorting domain-containing protein [Bacteroidales bacterium]